MNAKSYTDLMSVRGTKQLRRGTYEKFDQVTAYFSAYLCSLKKKETPPDQENSQSDGV